MKYKEESKIEKYYVIPESLMFWLKVLAVILIITVILWNIFGFYIFFRIEAGHYPTKLLDVLERIALK